MVIPVITIDGEKCKAPLNCAICMQLCPQAVFKAKPAKVYKFRETPEEEYTLSAVYWTACTGCNECVKQCPAGAINISYRELKVDKGALENG